MDKLQSNCVSSTVQNLIAHHPCCTVAKTFLGNVNFFMGASYCILVFFLTLDAKVCFLQQAPGSCFRVLGLPELLTWIVTSLIGDLQLMLFEIQAKLFDASKAKLYSV